MCGVVEGLFLSSLLCAVKGISGTGRSIRQGSGGNERWEGQKMQ